MYFYEFSQIILYCNQMYSKEEERWKVACYTEHIILTGYFNIDLDKMEPTTSDFIT